MAGTNAVGSFGLITLVDDPILVVADRVRPDSLEGSFRVEVCPVCWLH